MTEAEILTEVKKALGITGNHLDTTLMPYVHEVILYLADAGVKQEVLSSDASVGVVTRGVLDLWNYGAAGGSLSNYFMQRAGQLRYSE